MTGVTLGRGMLSIFNIDKVPRFIVITKQELSKIIATT